MRTILRVALILGVILCGSTAWCEDPESAWDVSPAMVGTKIPDISFTNSEGKAFSLRDRVKEKPLVLVVYRGLW
jgi:cytochrome oxidase Cu insertion factor (SCO1/SenC/PrrC family)